MMRAWQVHELGEPQDVLRLEQVPDPEAGTGLLRLRVDAVALNFPDVLLCRGQYQEKPPLPFTPGLEVCGTVLDGPRAGERVLASPGLPHGGMAEQVVVAEAAALPVPEAMPAAVAASLLITYQTGYVGLHRRAQLREGETLLVHAGAGGVGSAAIQLGKAAGARVLATAGGPEKVQVCRDLGADHAFSYRDDWAAEVREVTDGRGVDVVLDNMGAKYLETHVQLLAPDGRLVVIGFQGGRTGTIDLGVLLAKRGTVAAISLRGRPVEQKADICRHVAAEVWPLLADGTIKPTPLTTYALDEVVDAHRALESGDNVGKIVLRVRG